MSSVHKKQIENSPKGYRKWAIALAGMVLAFVGYVLYSRGELVGTCPPTLGQSAGSVPADSVVQIAAGNEASASPLAFLGVEIIPVDSVIAEQLEIPGGGGILIKSVVPDSPAENAGLERGDVIVSLANRPVKDMGSFRKVMATLSPGDNVRLGYIREGKRNFVYVELADQPAILKTAAQDTGSTDTGWGVSLSATSSALRETYGIPADVDGVVILSVVAGGAADEVGLAAGDVITGIAQTRISDLDDLFGAGRC